MNQQYDDEDWKAHYLQRYIFILFMLHALWIIHTGYLLQNLPTFHRNMLKRTHDHIDHDSGYF